MELHSWFQIIEIIDDCRIRIRSNQYEYSIRYNGNANIYKYKLYVPMLMYIVFDQNPFDNTFTAQIISIVGDND